jgi:methionine aminopeptidase
MLGTLQSIAPELRKIEQFNAIIGREKRNAKQAYLQSKMLISEAFEGLDADSDITEIRDAIADVIVVAQGGCFIADAYPVGHIVGGTLKLSSLDQIFTSSADSVTAEW